jgi:hypothetical protein
MKTHARWPHSPYLDLTRRRGYPPVRRGGHRLDARVVVLCLVLLLVAHACSQSGGGSDIAIRIDGEPVHYGTFEAYLRANVDPGAIDLESKALSNLFDQFLDEQLLIRLAAERGLVKPHVDQRDALAYLLRDHEPELPESQLRAYYEAHLAEYQRPERVRLRLILVYDRPPAEKALAELRRGEDFAQVAARYSQDPKAQLGGDQGLLGHEDLPPSFADTIFGLEAGEISGIVKADYGFQIFKVEEKLPSATLSFEAARPEIEQQMRRQVLDEAMTSLIAEARRRSRVELFLQNFPFDYEGAYAAKRS